MKETQPKDEKAVADESEQDSKIPSFADLILEFPGEPGDIPKRSRKPTRRTFRILPQKT